jgi:hypothetical protein
MTKISSVVQTYAKADGSSPVNTDTLRSMSFNMHLDYVDGFLSRGTKKRLNNNKVKREYTQTDLFMTIFYPAAVGKPDYVFPSGVQKANGGTRMPIDYTKKACSEFSPFPLVPNISIPQFPPLELLLIALLFIVIYLSNTFKFCVAI